MMLRTPLRHGVIKWSGGGTCNDITSYRLLEPECHIYYFNK